MAVHDREGVLAGTVDDIATYVADGLSVHVLGPHASGRSELLGLVADRLEDGGATVLRIFGNPAWRGEPFGALVAAGIGPATAPTPRRTVGEMSTALTQQLRGRNVVVVVDDADDLDAQSVGALLTVHRQRHVVAVTSSRPEHPVRADSLVPGLAPAVRVRAPILDVDQVHEVCRAILGGPVESATLARLAMKSGGLLGLVRAIATIGRHAGRLQLRDGLWTIPFAGGRTEAYGAALDPFLAGADQSVWDAATALAVTGPIPLPEAERLLDRPMLDRLFASGLARLIDDGAGGVVGIYPPLLGDYLAREGSAFGVVEAREHAAAQLLPPPAFDPGQAIGADAALLNQRTVLQSAEVVTRAREQWRDDVRPETALPLVVALRAAAAPADRIEEVVHRTPLGGESAPAASLVAWYATWLAEDRGDIAAAYAALDDQQAGFPHFAGLLRATRAHLQFLRERVPDESALAEPSADEDAFAHEAMAMVRAELLLAAGSTAPALEILTHFRPQTSAAKAYHRILTGLARVLAGDLDDGTTHALDQLGRAYEIADPGLIQAHSYVAVLGLGIAGRLGDAGRVVFRSLSSSSASAFRQVWNTGLLTLGAEIALAQGRPEYARTLAAQALAADSGRGPYPGMEPAVVAPMIPSAPAAGVDLWQLVQERLERGYVTGALFLAVETVERAGASGPVESVRARADKSDSALLRALGEYVAAAAVDDVDRLRAVAAELAQAGAGLYTTRVHITLALALRRRGEAAAAVAAAERAWRESAVAGFERAGLFYRLVDDVGLSAREVEILQLLAAPQSTAEVATTLQMSVRTVETHLHNISRKIGVSGREQLVRAATTWLRPAQR
ncbi:LuxR C-terminal-related transcriptional regulator [Nocardioides sp. DS6]|uniref:LuxR C-terminal-related transcriptional regulator n=1 Tax=Nocardioides eburneus TaxID=3231482 RepID=A0ABV3T145_9ACTN